MKKKKSLTKSLIFGALIGSVNGLLGGGGGMLGVPALAALGLDAKQSHATAILLILPISVISAIVYAASGRIQTDVLWSAGLGVVIGGAIGACLLSKLNGRVIRVAFAVLMIAVGLRQFFG